MTAISEKEKEKLAKRANMRFLLCALLFLAALFGVIWSSIKTDSLRREHAEQYSPQLRFNTAQDLAFVQSVKLVSFALLIITPLILIMLIKIELHEDTILMLVEELEERERGKRVPKLPDTFEQDEE